MSFTSRVYRGEPDRALVLDLRRACTTPENATDFPTLVDLSELLASGTPTGMHTRLWFDDSGQLIACAMAHLPYRNLYWLVRPGSSTAELENHIVAFGLAAVRKYGIERAQALTLDSPSRDSDVERVAVLERHGFVRQAEGVLRMLRPLDEAIANPALPPGFTVRPMAGEQEVEAYVALHRAAFGTEHMTVEHRLAIMREADYRAAGDLVAVAPDSTLAAFCVCQIHPDENAQTGQHWGWTDPLGVHPAYQRKGLGRAILLAGLRFLREQGMETAALGTASTNPAQRLYTSVGFRTAFTYLWFSKAM